jgi:hypothetical protein
MSKQTIKFGNLVDDGTGDYLRLGAEKIQSNMDELYTQLGDGSNPHPAGAWKNIASTPSIIAKFGEAFNINTTNGQVNVTLPKGTANDYGKVIRLRDVWGTWGTNPVTIIPAAGNTIKGGATTRKLNRDYQDVELVLASPGSWEYVENKLIDRISMTDISTVAKQEYIAIDSQRDFINVFGETLYNVRNVEVYRRGNLLYYGKDFSATSDYGSPQSGSATGLVKLDGHSIRLKEPCEEGDVITVITYLDDIAVYRTSYISRSIRVHSLASGLQSVAGQRWVGDLSKKRFWTMEDFNLTTIDGYFNPFSTEALINGHALTMGGKGGLPAFACETTEGLPVNGNTEELCIAAGGQWVESGIDYSVVEDEDGYLSQIKVSETLEDGDILTIRWFNNDIGTTLTWDQIKDKSDDMYLNNEYVCNRSKKLRYNNYDDPNPCTIEVEEDVEENIRLLDISMLLDTVYPIGSIYMNAHNTNNPALFMGFGTWVPYAEGQSIVGWDHGTDANFSYYSGTCSATPIKSPGGAGGNVSHQISKEELPELVSTDEVLIKDPNGDVLIGSCMIDPDEGPAYRKYREDPLTVNQGARANAISLLQPYVTVAAWLRVR